MKLLRVVVSAVEIGLVTTLWADGSFYSLGVPSRYVYGISRDGKTAIGGANGPAFRWTIQGGIESLGLGGSALAISANGVITGTTGTGGFRWEQGSWTLLTGNSASPRCISKDGSIIGGSIGGPSAVATYWDPSGRHVLENVGLSGIVGMSDDGSMFVGSSGAFGSGRAFRYARGGSVKFLPNLPGRSESAAMASSSDCSIVACSSFGSTEIAYLWQDGVGTTVIDVPGVGSRVGAMTHDANFLFVTSSLGKFIWSPWRSPILLAGLLSTENVQVPTGWRLDTVTAMTVSNSMLTMVGMGANPEGRQEAWMAVVAVPEPSSIIEMLVGLALLFMRRAK